LAAVYSAVLIRRRPSSPSYSSFTVGALEYSFIVKLIVSCVE
jgi:hypothetical protein